MRPPRLAPFDLDADELAQRRRDLVRRGCVAVLSNGWAVSVVEWAMLGDLWESLSFVGRVKRCPLGVESMPEGEYVSFEPCHVERTVLPWEWSRLGPRPPRPPLKRLPAFDRVLPRTRRAFRRAYALPPRSRHLLLRG